MKTYNGKNIAAGYRKHFGVDWICAFSELEILDVRVDPGYKQRVLKSVEGQLAASQRRKAQHEESYEEPPEQDEYYAYIADYTAAGFAYGVTWEEWERLELIDQDGNKKYHGTQIGNTLYPIVTRACDNLVARPNANRTKQVVRDGLLAAATRNKR